MTIVEKICKIFNPSLEIINIIKNLVCNFCFNCLNCNKITTLILQDFVNEKCKRSNSSNIMVMNIITGMGGEDAQEITNQLLNMYFKALSTFDYINVYDNNIVFTNEKLFNLLSKYEKCIYKIVRISPFSNKKQTSYIGISFTNCILDTTKIKMEDIEFRYTRSSGAGGQHVNKTNSCVIAKHIPTNISVRVSQERNQIQNKNLAIKILEYKVNNSQILKTKRDKKLNYTCEQKISFGSNFNRYINMHKDKFIKINGSTFRHNEDDISNILIIPIIFKNIIDSN